MSLGIINYLKRKKLQGEIKKVENTIEKQQDNIHSNMEYLSLLKRDMEQINKNRRRKK